MAKLFSPEWMEKFMEEWNNEPDLKDALAKIGFDSTIGYGFKGEDQPQGVIVVEKGECTRAGSYTDETPNWDLRADQEDWGKWLKKPPGMMGLGVAYTSGKIKFKVGDYGAMIKDPRMAGPFIKSFEVMGRVDTDE